MLCCTSPFFLFFCSVCESGRTVIFHVHQPLQRPLCLRLALLSVIMRGQCLSATTIVTWILLPSSSAQDGNPTGNNFHRRALGASEQRLSTRVRVCQGLIRSQVLFWATTFTSKVVKYHNLLTAVGALRTFQDHVSRSDPSRAHWRFF